MKDLGHLQRKGNSAMTKHAFLAAFLFAVFARNSIGATCFYIAPDGNDVNPGTENKPFRTITRAKDAVRAVNNDMSDSIVVYLRGGTYRLTDTVWFDPDDSGTNGHCIVYRNYPDEVPVISGGIEINGWSHIGEGVYKAPVDQNLDFRQLYVNGTPAIRARYPNDKGPIPASFHSIAAVERANRIMKVNSAEIDPWASSMAPERFRDVEIFMLNHFECSFYRLDSYTANGAVADILLQEPERTRAFSTLLTMKSGLYYRYENALEILDSPGEWYLNTDTDELFYMPRTGENMATAEVIAPIVERLIFVQGHLDGPKVENLRFEGLSFEHTTWMLPSQEGFKGHQGGAYEVDEKVDPRVPWPRGWMPGGVEAEAASNIHFCRSRFRNMGGAGLATTFAVRNLFIEGNVFTQIAGNGMTINRHSCYRPIYGCGVWPDGTAGTPPDERYVTDGVTIRNNHVFEVGCVYTSGVGILCGFVSNCTIEHNYVHDLNYTGISVGWGWDVADFDTVVMENNYVQCNRVHNVMRYHDDGAGIYTLGRQGNSRSGDSHSRIRENYIHDIQRAPIAGSSPIAGIYNDQGSNLIRVERNVIVNVDKKYNLNTKSSSGIVYIEKDSNDAAVIAKAGIQDVAAHGDGQESKRKAHVSCRHE